MAPACAAGCSSPNLAPGKVGALPAGSG